MSFPEAAQQIYAFATTLPSVQQPGNKLDQEFADIRRLANGLLDRLKQIQDSDGQLARASVGIDQLRGNLAEALLIRMSERLSQQVGRPLNLVAIDQFTADGVTVGFPLSASVSGTQPLLVTVHGVVQELNAYSAAGSKITFAAPPPAGQVVEVRRFDGPIPVDRFIGDGKAVDFTLSRAAPSGAWALIAVCGVVQAASAYNIKDNFLTFGEPPPDGVVCEARLFWELPLPPAVIVDAKCCC